MYVNGRMSRCVCICVCLFSSASLTCYLPLTSDQLKFVHTTHTLKHKLTLKYALSRTFAHAHTHKHKNIQLEYNEFFTSIIINREVKNRDVTVAIGNVPNMWVFILCIGISMCVWVRSRPFVSVLEQARSRGAVVQVGNGDKRSWCRKSTHCSSWAHMTPHMNLCAPAHIFSQI